MGKIITFLAAIFPTFALAHDYTLGDLIIAHPVALETAQSAMTGAGYLTITNTGLTDEQLIGVSADFPRVMVHETIVEGGVTRMQHQDAVTIPGGGTVTFAPGGLHVMFMGLAGDPFERGESIPATLTFQGAGTVDVLFNVVSRDELPTTENHDAQ